MSNAQSFAGETFTVLFSSTNGGPFGGSTTLPGGLSLPLVWDSVSNWTLANSASMSDILDVSGFGSTRWIKIPPGAAGMTIWASAAIHDGLGQVFFDVSPALVFEVQ
jgi:hypothetical protein